MLPGQQYTFKMIYGGITLTQVAMVADTGTTVTFRTGVANAPRALNVFAPTSGAQHSENLSCGGIPSCAPSFGHVPSN